MIHRWGGSFWEVLRSQVVFKRPGENSRRALDFVPLRLLREKGLLSFILFPGWRKPKVIRDFGWCDTIGIRESFARQRIAVSISATQVVIPVELRC